MKKLVDSLKNSKIISVFGNSKNAGKTTVINYLLEQINSTKIAISSIGYDGEDFDQVNFMEKPKVFVREGYIVATAEGTLKSWEAEYEILWNSHISTAMGTVLVVKITKAGNALIAGPSVISDMEKTIFNIEKYDLDYCFIDGAFFRQSLSRIADGSIYVVGANRDQSMDSVIEEAALTYRKYQLKKPGFDTKYLENTDKVCLVNKDLKIQILPFSSVIGNTAKIFTEENQNFRFLYLPKTLSKNMLNKLIELRNKYTFDLIVSDPNSIQLDSKGLKSLFKLQNQVYVLNPIKIIATCVNPYSPRGYHFNKQEFSNKLGLALGCEIFDVKGDY